MSLFSGQAGLTRFFFLSRRLYNDGLETSACHMTFRVGRGLVGLTLVDVERQHSGPLVTT